MSHLSEPLLISSGQIPKSGITKSRSINTFFEILGELCQITLKRIVLLPALCDIWAPYFKRFVNDVSQFFLTVTHQSRFVLRLISSILNYESINIYFPK